MYVDYDVLRGVFESLPLPIQWSERALKRLATRPNSDLPYVPAGPRTAAAQWDSETLVRWFAKRYRRAPELVEMFTKRIRVAASEKETA